MKKGLILILIFIFLLASFSFIISAETYKLNSKVDIKIATNESACNITVQYPNTTNIIENEVMSLGVGYANYTLSSDYTSQRGEYAYYSDCGSDVFKITPTGIDQTTSESLVSSIILILFVTLTIIFLIIGFKLSETEKLWVLGIFLMGVSVFFLVYDLYLGYAYSLNYVGSDMSKIPETLFYIFAVGVAAGLLTSAILLFRYLPKIVEWFKINSGKKDSDGWDNNQYD